MTRVFAPELLLERCAEHVARSPHVALDEAALAAVVARVDPADLRLPDWSGPAMLEGEPEEVTAWLLAYNAINYSYFPEPGQPRWWTVVAGAPAGVDDEALGIMAAFAQALRGGVPLGDGSFLAGLSAASLEALLPPAPGAGPLPLLSERLAGLHELGGALQRMGGPAGFLQRADGSAVAFVQALAEACPTWDDAREGAGGRLHFLKRAQLCAAMLHGRLGLFSDAERLTAFADYRLPQILRFLGVLRLAPALVARIDAGGPIPVGSPEEVALRAGTVHAADRLCAAWETDALRVDYWLWRAAVDHDAEIPPFHRTRTTDY